VTFAEAISAHLKLGHPGEMSGCEDPVCAGNREKCLSALPDFVKAAGK
jgi:hypothetical protein